MHVLLTGITGNLGHELAFDLAKRNIQVTPIVRPGKKDLLAKYQFENIVEHDLLDQEEITFSGKASCIVHAAGNVHFRDAGNTNELMLTKLISLAKRLKIPLYFVSTAYVYRPEGTQQSFNNNYEQDKYQAEQLLNESGISHAIFRPSILVGNSKTGEIQNFSGYYLIVKAFVHATEMSRRKGRKLRFPKLRGKSDIIPIDQVAATMGERIENKNLESVFITNPQPPDSSWLLNETLAFFNLSTHFQEIDCVFEEFGELDLTEEEQRLYLFGRHFDPYWSIPYTFPGTVCDNNLIDRTYLAKILTYFRDTGGLRYAKKDH